MSITPYAFRAETALDLEAGINARLAPLLNDLIFDIEIDQVEPGPAFYKNLYAAFTSSNNGALIGAPFQFKVFSQPTESEAITKVVEFVTANPLYFFSGVYVVYRPRTPDPNEAVVIGIFYNIAGVAASVNWGGTTIAVGAVGGDLSGNLPNPNVVGIHGVSINAGPFPGGGQITYDSTTNTFKWYVVQVYASLAAAAAAQANQIIGQEIIVAAGNPGAGTYVLNVKTGNPGDYTLVSTLTNVASQVALDAPIVGLNAANVFAALQVLTGIVTGPIAPASTVDLASVTIANFASVVWEFTIARGNLRYSGTVQAQHDGTNPEWNIHGPVIPAGPPFDVTLTCVVAGGNLTLQAVNTGLAATFRVRTRGLPI